MTKGRLNKTEAIFRDIQQALSGFDNCPTMDTMLGRRTIHRLISDDNSKELINQFAAMDSYYYSVLFTRNVAHKKLSAKNALKLVKARHKLELEIIKNSHEEYEDWE